MRCAAPLLRACNGARWRVRHRNPPAISRLPPSRSWHRDGHARIASSCLSAVKSARPHRASCNRNHGRRHDDTTPKSVAFRAWRKSPESTDRRLLWYREAVLGHAGVRICYHCWPIWSLCLRAGIHDVLYFGFVCAIVAQQETKAIPESTLVSMINSRWMGMANIKSIKAPGARCKARKSLHDALSRKQHSHEVKYRNKRNGKSEAATNDASCEPTSWRPSIHNSQVTS